MSSNGFQRQEEDIVSDAPANSKVRINVNIPRDTYEQLEKSVDNWDITMSDFVRSAIRVYYTLRLEINEGNHIYVGKNSKKIEKEVLIP